MKTKVEIPVGIRNCYEQYGFAKELTTAMAVRQSGWDWFAILLKDGGELYAVDFVTDRNGNWEVSNDYIGPFESVDAFLTEKLTSSFI